MLSIITVILGSLAIAAVFTINKNVDYYADQKITETGGPNLFVYSKSNDSYFSLHDLNLLNSLTGTRYVTIDSELEANLIYKDKSIKSKVFRYGENYSLARPITTLEGQFLSDWDLRFPSNNIVISEETRRQLGPTSPIGKLLLINVQNRNLYGNIIGVSKAEFDPIDRGMIWLSPSLYRELSQNNSIYSLIIGTTSFEGLDAHELRISESLTDKFGGNLAIYNPTNYVKNLKAEYLTFINAGMAIGLLSLIGGSVGVMNLMLMSIRLRVREIGLYRAMGFSNATVLQTFLFESMIILSFGGLVGSLLGCITGYAIAFHIMKSTPLLSYTAFLFAFLSSAFIGLFFSYFPALKASKMDTVEALRS